MSYPGQPPPTPPATPYGAPPPYAEPPKGRMNGCLIGCLAVLGLTGLVAVIGGFVAFTQFKKLRENWTETAPVAIPAVVITDPEWTALEARVDQFQDEMKAGTRTEPLKMKENEINAFLQRDKDFAEFGKRFSVDVEGDKLKGQLSVPLEGIPGLTGRYLNGTFYARLGLRDGEIYPSLLSADVKDKPVPEEILNELNKKIEEDVRKAEGKPSAGAPGPRPAGAPPNPSSEWKQKLKSIEIADDAVTLVPEPPKSSTSGDGAAPEAAAPEASETKAADEAKPAAAAKPAEEAAPAKKTEPEKAAAEPTPTPKAKKKMAK